ncbi:hypothetical protein NQ317_017492 [Molorchus minor]|uniref:Adenylate kinase isoenzyme 5 n=1 Tax=Molorchus minor TaxID=1323400 RepID=A0ABQ9JKM3_9CUCU|nr:hypothetical protein NQ317_017492 [Molorchus minor]
MLSSPLQSPALMCQIESILLFFFSEQSDGSQAFEEGQESWAENSPRGRRSNAVTPPAGKFPMHNGTDIHFESPKAPVIFVLGGPGSGKVTHCDNLMHDNQGITHINMTDLLQQYAIGNDMPDFSLLSSKTVTEVLMLEMKLSPNAKTFLVSGYPRNMRDVVEYSEKIQMVQGVILISWRQKVLERQIDYGAKLGQVVLSLARMELSNFYKNVIPVAEYFDQSNMLISINGERPPGDVFKEFNAAVFRILGMQDNPPVFSNGNAVTLSSEVKELPKGSSQPASQVSTEPLRSERLVLSPPRPQTQIISVNSTLPNYRSPTKGYPPVLWVIGGPGSNKAVLCAAAARETGWTHVSLGKLLRAAAEPPDPKHNSEVSKLRQCISNGELVPQDIVMRYVESHMADNMDKEGIILDGFPRDMVQVSEFETKFRQKPTIILLDCSKLQLGRGRLDDSVTAFRRRLEIFRQSSLPMLKAMDNIGRLTIVDGDTDTVPVQEDFKSVVKEHIEYIKSQVQENESYSSHVTNGHIPNNQTTLPNNASNGYANGHIPNGYMPGDTHIQDLEDEPIDTISKRVGNGVAHTIANGVNNLAKGHSIKAPQIANGFAGSGLPMYGEVNYMDGHI